MGDPMHFDARAEVYQRYRPPYPESLWARLRGLGVLGRGVSVLELGAGTGEATGRLVDAGATVTAVEPGHALAARLRRRVPDARGLEETAEEVDLPDAAFDLAIAATAAHWWSIDLDTEQVRGLFGTFSDWSTAEVEAAARAAEDLGGLVTEHYLTLLILLDRNDLHPVRRAGPGG